MTETPPPTLCQTARSLAAETWDLMGFAFARQNREPDERAFTDHNMLWMERLHGSQVRVELFDQHQEKRTGADFEWWIGDGHTYLPMLVQAKRLGRDGRYAALSRTKGKRQLDDLIAACTQGHAGPEFLGYLPAYLFYNTETIRGIPPDQCCGTLWTPKDRGCTIAHAVEIRTQLNARPRTGKTSISRIGAVAMPWGCLFCCPMRGGLAPAAWVRDRIELPGSPEEWGDQRPPVGDGERARSRGADELPAYVRAMLDAEREFAAGLDLGDLLPGAQMVVVTTTAAQAEEEIRVEPRD